jgi:hypothetical protein
MRRMIANTDKQPFGVTLLMRYYEANLNNILVTSGTNVRLSLNRSARELQKGKSGNF